MNHQVELIANEHCACGENPLWDERQQCLYWTDIPNGRLFRWNAADGEWHRIYDGPIVGGFTLQENGNLLLFRDHDIAELGDDGNAKVLLEDFDPKAGRFNDVVATPRGDVFAGTMGENLQGGLYHIHHDATYTKLEGGTNCSNGQDFSPDLSLYYWSDSTAKNVYQYHYDQQSGAISNQKVLSNIPGNDGLTIDNEGCLWVAYYGDGAVRRISPKGQVLETLKIPAPKVTSVIFGGADFDQLFITTAEGEDGSDTLDGALFRAIPGVKGRASFRSKIG